MYPPASEERLKGETVKSLSTFFGAVVDHRPEGAQCGGVGGHGKKSRHDPAVNQKLAEGTPSIPEVMVSPQKRT